MKTRLMALATISALLLTGCSKEETAIDTLADTPITVTAGINEPGTRAGAVISDIQTGGFGLFINSSNSTYSYSNVYMSYDETSSKWNSFNNNTAGKTEQTMLWQNSSTGVHVVAYYPYQPEITNNTISGSILTNQSSNQESSDLMFSTSDVTPSNPNASNAIYYDGSSKSLNVGLNHALSKIRVNIQLTGILKEGTSNISTATIDNLKTKYSLNLATEQIAIDEEDTSTDFTMFKEATAVPGNDATFELIVLPGEDMDNNFSIIINEKTYSCQLKVTNGETTSKRESGKLYTFNLTAGKDRLSVNNVSVNDWAAGATIIGEAE